MVNKIFYIILWFILSFHATFVDWWILWDFKWGDGATEKALRSWDIHNDDIPNIIRWWIDFLMGISWTISVIFIIVWAYQILFGSLAQDRTKWRNTIIIAISWFAIASLAWFIIRVILDNLWA